MNGLIVHELHIQPYSKHKPENQPWSRAKRNSQNHQNWFTSVSSTPNRESSWYPERVRGSKSPFLSVSLAMPGIAISSQASEVMLSCRKDRRWPQRSIPVYSLFICRPMGNLPSASMETRRPKMPTKGSHCPPPTRAARLPCLTSSAGVCRDQWLMPNFRILSFMEAGRTSVRPVLIFLKIPPL